MALTNAQLVKVRDGIDWGASINGYETPWTHTEIDQQLQALDTFADTNDLTINTTFSVAFRNITSVSDRALIYLALIIARRLINSPAHLTVLKSMIDRLV